MIDIHNHLLFGVDDGPSGMEESILMLKEAKKQGITDIVLTPHYRRGMFRFDNDLIEEHYQKLIPYAKEIGIRLHLGTEYHVNSDITEYLESKRCYTLAESEYVLTEYGYDVEYSYITQRTRELLRNGYVPVIAHVERYACLIHNPELIFELGKFGALIQVNAGAIVGEEGFSTKQYCKKLLKNGWIDIVASDSHGVKKRACHMRRCYEYISKKYGEKMATHLMVINPGKIVGV